MGNYKTVGNIHGAKKIGDKEASCFTVREAPWHGCGHLFTGTPSIDQALVAMKGDFVYDKVPALYKGNEVPGHYWIVRTDTDTPVGEVGDAYFPIQRRKAYDFLEAIGGDIELVSGGILGIGERDFMACKLPSTTKIAGDLIDHYFAILNSYDGSSSFTGYITPIRFVCQNTINLGIARAARKFSIRHTPGYEAKFKEAARVLGLVKDYYSTFDQVMASLIKQKFSEKQFGVMVNELLKKPDDEASDRRVILFEKQRDLMFEAYNVPDIANFDGTAWKAYNAVADYADHARLSRGEDEAKKAANRFIRTFQETDLKDGAFEYLTKAGR